MQRVPVNDTRKHTSTVTVAIVQESDVAISVNESDCDFESFRGSGAGGQHRNTTDSAVRITHRPTGIVVKCESQRSWWQNKTTAMIELARRIGERESQSMAAKVNSVRVDQIGIGDRSSHDWTWCGWRDEVHHHHTGVRFSMSAALKGKADWR